VPTKVQVTQHTGRWGRRWNCLEFSLGAYTVQWLSDDPEYEAILAAVQGKGSLVAWVSPKQASTIGSVTVPLYKLESGDKVILDYATSLNRRESEAGLGLLGGAVILVLGCLGFVYCVLQSRRARDAGCAR
jgi:hypothetical protein